MDGEENLIQVPRVPGVGPPAPQGIGIGLTTLPTPVSHGFVRQHEAMVCHPLLDITIARGKAIGEPHTMADDRGGEPMALVYIGDRWCVHAVSMPTGLRGDRPPA